MKTRTHTTLLTTITALSMVGAANATTIFSATTGNTTNYSNDVNGSAAANISVTGAIPNLDLNNDGGNFFLGGFNSTDTINTLKGSALTEADTVTLTVTIDSIVSTGTAEIRSRGVEFGLNTFRLGVGGSGNSGNMVLNSTGGHTLTSDPFRATLDSTLNGFSITLVADVSGFAFSFTGLDAQNPGTNPVVDLTGTFAAGEFLANFGTGQYELGVQKRNPGTTTLNISQATIDVVPEPTSAALLGLAGFALLLRRRK